MKKSTEWMLWQSTEQIKRAVDRARRGDGPTLIECDTYRFEGHEEGNPWTTYRTKEEVDEWKKRDPIINFGKKLVESGVLTQKEIEQIASDVEKEISDAIKFADDSPLTNVEEAFEDVYASN